MNLDQRILITGGHSATAANIKELLQARGLGNIMVPNRNELNLTNHLEVKDFFHTWKPDCVLHIAARTTNARESRIIPWDILRDNFLIEYNVFEMSAKTTVSKLVWVSSDSALPYSDIASLQTEDDLFQTPLRKEIEPYALAKLVGVKMCEYINAQSKKNSFISLLPCYIYGDVKKGLLYTLVKDFIKAKLEQKKEVQVWGKSSLLYRFIHSRDLASAIFFAVSHEMKYDRYIVAPERAISKADLAKLIAESVGYHGKIRFDETDLILPAANASPSRINAEGWKAKITLEDGVRELINWLSIESEGKET